MISYKLDDKIGIVKTLITEEVTTDDIIDYINSLSQDKTLPKKLKILTDATKGMFPKHVEPEDMQKIAEANINSLAVRDLICDAFLLSAPFETALGQIYIDYSKHEKYNFEIFATKLRALNWLNNF